MGCSDEEWEQKGSRKPWSVPYYHGSFGRRLAQLAKTDVVIMDDWGLTPLDQAARSDLLELLDDRVGTRSTIVVTSRPISDRPTQAIRG